MPVTRTAQNLAPGWTVDSLFEVIRARVADFWDDSVPDQVFIASGENTGNEFTKASGEIRALCVNGIMPPVEISANLSQSESVLVVSYHRDYLAEDPNTLGIGLIRITQGSTHFVIGSLSADGDNGTRHEGMTICGDFLAEYNYTGSETFYSKRDAIPQIKKPYPDSDRFVQKGIAFWGDGPKGIPFILPEFALIAAEGRQIGEQLTSNTNEVFEIIATDGLALQIA